MEWLNGPPTHPGLYWWTWIHEPGTLRFVNVSEVNGKMTIPGSDGGFQDVRKPLRYWFGPFPAPDYLPLPEPRTKGWDE